MTSTQTSLRRHPGLKILLALLLVLEIASTAAAAAAGAAQREIPSAEAAPLKTVQFGPTRPLRAIAAVSNSGGSVKAASTRFTPVVSARSVLLRNNITISQSRLVLSSLDQLFLLQRLVDLVDLAPKLAGTAAMKAAEHVESMTEMPPQDEDSSALGFLFNLDAVAKLDSDADVAIVNLGGTKIGFGWRYPLSFWTRLDAREKPTCAVGIVVGRYYYC